MINALEVLGEMYSWWESTSPLPRTPQQAVNIGITWLFNRTHPDYLRIQLESSRLAHIRQLFTVWKAVCLRMKSYPFAMTDQQQAIKAFPLYMADKLSEVFVQAYAQRIFLGVTFTPEEQARFAEIARRYTASSQPLSPAAARNMRGLLRGR